jgi:hypothetical protein
MLTLSQFKAQERERIAAAKSGNLSVACDECGAALVDSEPGSSLMTAPPQMRVHCSVCKWKGLAPASVRRVTR